jgi:outer membrane receptor protein involved in Fe transport
MWSLKAGALKVAALSSVSAAALLVMPVTAREAKAQSAPAPQAAQAPSVEEIVVTGSRVIRDGYEAPTPVTVVGVEQIEQANLPNVADYVNQMPAFAGAQTSRDGGNAISGGHIGENNLNLRGLGATRTLALLDGHRIISASTSATANINDLPQNLISRVDVVTGGASAAYGSDALAGVANFILDTKFVGVKGSVTGSVTTYGDDRRLNMSIAAGTGFANDRGHLLLSYEYSNTPLVNQLGQIRAWDQNTTKILNNPAYGTGPGQSTSVPAFLLRSSRDMGLIQSNPNGIIFSGPLKGIAFDKQGNPYQFQYGSLSDTVYTIGGSATGGTVQPNMFNQSLEDHLYRSNPFARISYDITDDINVYANFFSSYSTATSNGKSDDSYGGSPGSPIALDNAYLPASVRAMMVAAKVTTISVGTYNLDLPLSASIYKRRMFTYALGGTGRFTAFDTDWKWDAQAQWGINRGDTDAYIINKANMTAAQDAVFAPNGAIVCRSNLNGANPACVPWNVFGSGHNTQAAIDYVKGHSLLWQQLHESVFSASVSGEPFSTWAGPVSVATGVEHRTESVHGVDDPISRAQGFVTANYVPAIGAYNVTEGFVETVVPLAKDARWAKSLELNAAMRATGYSTSGYVTTWKIGATYQPIDDIRLRATRSRDIRAPNLNDLFAAGGGSRGSNLLDPFNGNIPVSNVAGSAGGNSNLVPEEADTTGLGAVLQPTFFPGFSASFDLYNIDIGNAISSVGAQDTINLCYEGRTVFCSQIVRTNGVLSTVFTRPINFLSEKTRGYDIEASYRTRLDSLVNSWAGDLTVRALATHTLWYRKDTGFSVVTDLSGDNSGTLPKWRYNFSATYSLDPLTVTWTGRGLSAGHYSSTYIVCTSGCPVSTTSHPTIDNASIAGAFYQDISVTYKFMHKDTNGVDAEAFLSVSNLFNRDPAAVASSSYWYGDYNPQLYDVLGRDFHAGFRFRM